MSNLPQRLKAALRSGNGAEIADALQRIAGSAVEPADLASSLGRAAACIERRLQESADMAVGVPPGAPCYLLSFYLDSGLSTEFQKAITLFDNASKGRLARVSKYWQQTMMHPAFWTTLHLPASRLVRVKDATALLEQNASRFHFARRAVMPATQPPAGAGLITQLSKTCPHLTELDLRQMPSPDVFKPMQASGYNPSRGECVWDGTAPNLSLFTETFGFNDLFTSLTGMPPLRELRLHASQKLLYLPAGQHIPFVSDQSHFLSEEWRTQLPQRLRPLGTRASFNVPLKYSRVDGRWESQPEAVFAELRTLELQFLPFGNFSRAYDDNGLAFHAPGRTAAQATCDMVSACPKLESFVLQCAQDASVTLELDVQGLRSGQLDPEYLCAQYIDYLKAFPNADIA